MSHHSNPPHRHLAQADQAVGVEAIPQNMFVCPGCNTIKPRPTQKDINKGLVRFIEEMKKEAPCAHSAYGRHGAERARATPARNKFIDQINLSNLYEKANK